MYFHKFDPDLDEQKKNDSIAAGSNITTNHSVQPPAQMFPPIQGMFTNSQMMGLDSGFPDVAKTPTGPAPFAPIPYPNMGNANDKPGSINPLIGNKSPHVKPNFMPGMSMGDMPGSIPHHIPGLMTQPMPFIGQKGIGSEKDAGKKQGFIGSAISKIGDVVSKGAGMISDYASNFSSSYLGRGSDYIDAVNFAKLMFKLQAGFKNIVINGPSAFGSPGCLDGPDLELYIKAAPSTVAMRGNDKVMRNAIAKGVGNNFDKWRNGVMVPGSSWYPSFSFVPNSHAPPMPNIPMPLLTCPSHSISEIINASKLKSSIKSNLPGYMKTPETDAFLDGFCLQLSFMFLTWLGTQQIMLVMGTGPVPTYAPPFGPPGGPVVNGYTLPGKHLFA